MSAAGQQEMAVLLLGPEACALAERLALSGYQPLCGFNALDFARYRHTDNDLVRAARQQEFLRGHSGETQLVRSRRTLVWKSYTMRAVTPR
jgi:anionic cell wall polymer biosynthesis LytR-Cps2A-Psr (LCP) family protein